MLSKKLKARLLSIAGCGLLFNSFHAWGGPPFVTDDPEPVEYQHSEMYIASEQLHSKKDNTTTPLVEYNYGALPDLQLSITVPYVFDRAQGLPRQQGLGDITLGVKYRFLQETDSHPMMAIYPSIVTANGDASKGLGNGGSQIFLPVWIQKSWGDWQTYGGGGYWINNATHADNHWNFGWALQKNISEKLMVGGEIFRESEELSADSATGFGLGSTYNLDQHNRLLFSINHSFSHRRSLDYTSSYIAYGLTW
jgi:hypothetical protein